MASKPKRIGTGTWQSVPGLIELLQAPPQPGVLSAPASLADEQANAEMYRGVRSAILDPKTEATGWGAFLATHAASGQLTLPAAQIEQPPSWWLQHLEPIWNWLEGYRKERVVIDHQLTHVPLVTIAAPPGGSATVTYKRSSTSETQASFTLAGIGYGRSGILTIEEDLTIPVSRQGKQILVQVAVTCTRYVRRGSPARYAVDLDVPAGTNAPILVNDVVMPAPDPRAKPFDISRWNELDAPITLNGHDPKLATYTYHHEGSATWEVDLDVGVTAPLKTGLTAKVSIANSSEWVTTYELAWGYTYYMYGRPDETPLVPMIARV